MKISSILAPFALALAFVAGCVTEEPPARSPGASILQAPPPSECPFGVPETHTHAEDTEAGVALTFTSSGHVEELRARAAEAAKVHGPGAGAGIGHEGRHGSGGHHGLQGMQLPPFAATVEDVEGGAKLRLTPADPADLERLRARAHARAEKLASCR